MRSDSHNIFADNISENEDDMLNKSIKSMHQQASVDYNKPAASGIGILEFSPSMAGQDVTPINLEFTGRKVKKQPTTNTSFQSLADTLSQLAANAVKPIRHPHSPDFKLLQNDVHQMSKSASIEVKRSRLSVTIYLNRIC